MTIEVIKEAFTEGRNTDTRWLDSTAKENEIRLQTFLDNKENFNEHRFREKIPLQRLCPTTGKVLQTYGSRLEAARWICENVLHDTDSRRPVSITGNMQMCMSSGWKCYGFYWKTMTQTAHIAEIKTVAKANNSTMVFTNKAAVRPDGLFGGATRGCYSTEVHPSIAAAAKATGVSERQVRRCMDELSACRGNFFRKYNDKPKNMVFKTMEDAVSVLGAGAGAITKAHAENKAINNITFTLKIAPVVKREVSVFVGRNKVGTYPTVTAAAEAHGVVRQNVSKAIANNNAKIGPFRFVVTNRAVK